MQDFIAQFGDYAPLIFLLLASILPIFLFPPGIFSIIGGYLFGFKLGAILTITAAIVYTNVMFLISRYFARDYIEKFLVQKLSLKEFNRIFGIKENKLAVFLIIFRLIPILPNSVVSYSYGLTRISFKSFLSLFMFSPYIIFSNYSIISLYSRVFSWNILLIIISSLPQ